MKRRLLCALAGVVLVIWMVLPIPMPGDTGAFNVVSGLVWCNSPWACLHEQGHALDRSLGWQSQTDEFGAALKFYVLTNILTYRPSEMALRIYGRLFRPSTRWFWNEHAEIYADIYANANGNVESIPGELQKFYRKP